MRQDGFRSDRHRALAERERVVTESTTPLGQDAVYAAIAQDRAERWAKQLEGREELAEIREWAGQMTIRHRNQYVRAHRTVLPWVTALYVVRYGEAEDYWPEALTADDARRARGWLLGTTPEGVTYLPREA